MKHDRVSKFLNYSTVTKFVTKKLIKVNSLLNGQNCVDKNIKFKTLMLISDLCDHSNVHIVVKRVIDLSAVAANVKTEKDLASFRSCISKISNPLIENAEDLDIDMSIFNLLEYAVSHLMTLRSL